MDASSNNEMDTDDGPTRRKSIQSDYSVPSASNSSSIQRQLSSFHRYFTWKHLRTTIHSPPPASRSGAASVVVRGKLYVFGGYGGGTGRLSDFWQYDFDTGLWEEVQVLSAVKPGCRENNGVVLSESDRLIYLFGGYNGITWLNDLWQYDIDTSRWTCIQESSGTTRGNDSSNAAVGDTADNLVGPSRRFGYVAVVIEGNSQAQGRKLVLWGGFDGNRWLQDTWEYVFATSAWTEIQAKGPTPSARSCPAWAKDGNVIYIQGGYDGMERKSDFFAMDLTTYTWTELPCRGSPPSPRYFHACCLHGNRLYCYGGYSGTERLADMYSYDFSTHHWSVVDCSSPDAPSGRSSLVAQLQWHQGAERLLFVSGPTLHMQEQTNVVEYERFKLQPVGVPPTGLMRDMYKLLDDSETADVVFSVESKLVHAHKAILVVRSDFFRAMLLSGMREAAGEPIVVRDISYPVFMKVMEFIYTDCIRQTDLEVGIHLMIASEQFMLDRLKALCEDLIRSDITVDTVISIVIASHQHNAVSLKELALEFIQCHLDDPVVMRGLTELKSEPDLLLELVRRKQTTSPHSAALQQDPHDPFEMSSRGDNNNIMFHHG